MKALVLIPAFPPRDPFYLRHLVSPFLGFAEIVLVMEDASYWTMRGGVYRV